MTPTWTLTIKKDATGRITAQLESDGDAGPVVVLDSPDRVRRVTDLLASVTSAEVEAARAAGVDHL